MLNLMAGLTRATQPMLRPSPSRSITTSGTVGAGPSSRRQDEVIIAITNYRTNIIYDTHFPIVVQWMFQALRLLTAAEKHVSRLRAGMRGLPHKDPDRLAFLVAAKHFHLGEVNLEASTQALDRIERILRATMLVFYTNRKVFYVLWKQPPSAGSKIVDAYTYGGNLNQVIQGLKSVPYLPASTHYISERQKVMICPAYWDETADYQRAVLVHELAHALGPASPSRNTISDPAYVWENAYKGLSSSQRLDNADTYSAYVSEAAIGTSEAAPALGGSVTDIGAVPWVTTATPFNAALPTIDIPDETDPAGRKFVYPAVFT